VKLRARIAGDMAATAPGASSRCGSQVGKLFPWLFVRQLLDEHTPAAVADEAEELAEEVVGAFREHLGANTRLSPQTRQAALKKRNRIRVKVAAPAWVHDDVSMLRSYGFALDWLRHSWPLAEGEEEPNGSTPHAFVWHAMVLHAYEAYVREMFASAGRPRDWENDWHISPLAQGSRGAQYESLTNDIFVNSLVLQEPFFDQDAPRAFKYASFGSVVGHEVTHGFDSNGAGRDPWGDVAQWWSEVSQPRFEEARSCLKKSYNSLSFQGDRKDAGKLGEPDGVQYTDDGERCLAENMADVGGLNIAFSAFERWLAQHDRAAQGAKGFTAEQVFFLRFGAMYCDFKTGSDLQKHIESEDDHAVNRLRVNGAVRNSRAFAEAFKCKPHTPMNPEEKCDFWDRPRHYGSSSRRGHPGTCLLLLPFFLLFNVVFRVEAS